MSALDRLKSRAEREQTLLVIAQKATEALALQRFVPAKAFECADDGRKARRPISR